VTPPAKTESEIVALVRSVERFIQMFSDKSTRGWRFEDREEFLADMRFAAWRAARDFDPERGIRYVTLCGCYMRNRRRQILNERLTWRSLQAQSEIAVGSWTWHHASSDSTSNSAGWLENVPDASPVDDYALTDARTLLDSLAATVTLTSRQRTVLERLREGATYIQIARDLNVSREYIRQVANKVYAKCAEVLLS